MTDKVFPGRYTAKTDDQVIVFLIGMRVNKFWQFGKWLPVFNAMPPMIETLAKHPDKGMLSWHMYYAFFPMRVMLQTYWESFEKLEHFARSADDPHLSAWREFNKKIGKDGTVGIWHETYIIEPDKFEAVYGNMPAYGLAAATEHVPATGRRETARRRLGGENEPAVATP